jgi:hypothetical protein
MDASFVAFLIIFCIAVIFILLTSKKKSSKKALPFCPEFDGEMWINYSIFNLNKEDLCENCLNYIHCGIRKDAENIKQKYDRKFILTRCKIFQANNSLKMREKPEQQKHFNHMVWVNPFTERMREKQCMCINDCCNLNIRDRKKNCPMANELYDLCVQCNLATIVFSCPIWDMPQELV